jgi:hypothetical protein
MCLCRNYRRPEFFFFVYLLFFLFVPVSKFPLVCALFFNLFNLICDCVAIFVGLFSFVFLLYFYFCLCRNFCRPVLSCPSPFWHNHLCVCVCASSNIAELFSPFSDHC